MVIYLFTYYLSTLLLPFRENKVEVLLDHSIVQNKFKAFLHNRYYLQNGNNLCDSD